MSSPLNGVKEREISCVERWLKTHHNAHRVVNTLFVLKTSQPYGFQLKGACMHGREGAARFSSKLESGQGCLLNKTRIVIAETFTMR